MLQSYASVWQLAHDLQSYESLVQKRGVGLRLRTAATAKIVRIKLTVALDITIAKVHSDGISA